MPSLFIVEDGFRNTLRKKSGTQSGESLQSIMTPPSASSPPTAPPPGLSDALEPLGLQEALAKLFHPDGCEEEFENVFLGLFHYFMSWSLFVHHFGVIAKQVREVAPVNRSRYSNRLVQVVTKWLRLNQNLRNERMPVEDARLELERYLAGDAAPAAASSNASVLETPSNASVLETPSTPPRDLAVSAPAVFRNNANNSASSPRAIEVDSSEESSDEAPTPVTPLSTSSSTLSGSRSKIVMGSKKRASLFKVGFIYLFIYLFIFSGCWCYYILNLLFFAL